MLRGSGRSGFTCAGKCGDGMNNLTPAEKFASKIGVGSHFLTLPASRAPASVLQAVRMGNTLAQYTLEMAGIVRLQHRGFARQV